MFLSDQEYRSFKFFREVTSRQICGFHSRGFWLRQVPQMAQTDEGIRHAMIALAAVHERFQLHDPDTGGFALAQYNLAINQHFRALNDSRTRKHTEAYLVSCILFICIEVTPLDWPSRRRSLY